MLFSPFWVFCIKSSIFSVPSSGICSQLGNGPDQGQHLQIWGQRTLPEKGGMPPTHCPAVSELLPHTRNLRSSGSCGSWLRLIDCRPYFWLAFSKQLLGCTWLVLIKIQYECIFFVICLKSSLQYPLLHCGCEGHSSEYFVPMLSKFYSCQSIKLINSGLMRGLSPYVHL